MAEKSKGDDSSPAPVPKPPIPRSQIKQHAAAQKALATKKADDKKINNENTKSQIAQQAQTAASQQTKLDGQLPMPLPSPPPVTGTSTSKKKKEGEPQFNDGKCSYKFDVCRLNSDNKIDSICIPGNLPPPAPSPSPIPLQPVTATASQPSPPPSPSLESSGNLDCTKLNNKCVPVTYPSEYCSKLKLDYVCRAYGTTDDKCDGSPQDSAVFDATTNESCCKLVVEPVFLDPPSLPSLKDGSLSPRTITIIIISVIGALILGIGLWLIFKPVRPKPSMTNSFNTKVVGKAMSSKRSLNNKSASNRKKR